MNEPTAKPGWHLANAKWTFFVRREASGERIALRWWWRVVASNGFTWDGDETFDTLPLCQADAAMHGFVPGASSAV